MYFLFGFFFVFCKFFGEMTIVLGEGMVYLQKKRKGGREELASLHEHIITLARIKKDFMLKVFEYMKYEKI